MVSNFCGLFRMSKPYVKYLLSARNSWTLNYQASPNFRLSFMKIGEWGTYIKWPLLQLVTLISWHLGENLGTIFTDQFLMEFSNKVSTGSLIACKGVW